MGNIYVMRGLPGAGKTYYVNKKREEATDRKVFVVSADQFFTYEKEYRFDPKLLGVAHANCLRQFILYCTNLQKDPNFDMYVDNTNLTVAEMAPYVAIGEAYGHKVMVISIFCPKDVAFERNIHNVPKMKYTEMFDKYNKVLEEIPFRWDRMEFIGG